MNQSHFVPGDMIKHVGLAPSYITSVKIMISAEPQRGKYTYLQICYMHGSLLKPHLCAYDWEPGPPDWEKIA